MVFYNAIRKRDEATTNVLLLWSFLDNKDLWRGLFTAACKASADTTRILTEWIGEIASSKLEFAQAMRLLRNYSLIEETRIQSILDKSILDKAIIWLNR